MGNYSEFRLDVCQNCDLGEFRGLTVICGAATLCMGMGGDLSGEMVELQFGGIMKTGRMVGCRRQYSFSEVAGISPVLRKARIRARCISALGREMGNLEHEGREALSC